MQFESSFRKSSQGSALPVPGSGNGERAGEVGGDPAEAPFQQSEQSVGDRTGPEWAAVSAEGRIVNERGTQGVKGTGPGFRYAEPIPGTEPFSDRVVIGGESYILVKATGEGAMAKIMASPGFHPNTVKRIDSDRPGGGATGGRQTDQGTAEWGTEKERVSIGGESYIYVEAEGEGAKPKGTASPGFHPITVKRVSADRPGGGAEEGRQAEQGTAAGKTETEKSKEGQKGQDGDARPARYGDRDRPLPPHPGLRNPYYKDAGGEAPRSAANGSPKLEPPHTHGAAVVCLTDDGETEHFYTDGGKPLNDVTAGRQPPSGPLPRAERREPGARGDSHTK